MEMTKKLAEMMEKYPNIPVIPMVEGNMELNAEMWEQGTIVKVEVEDFVEGNTQLWFDGDEVSDMLQDMKRHDNQVPEYKDLAWECGIFIYIA